MTVSLPGNYERPLLINNQTTVQRALCCLTWTVALGPLRSSQMGPSKSGQWGKFREFRKFQIAVFSRTGFWLTSHPPNYCTAERCFSCKPPGNHKTPKLEVSPRSSQVVVSTLLALNFRNLYRTLRQKLLRVTFIATEPFDKPLHHLKTWILGHKISQVPSGVNFKQNNRFIVLHPFLNLMVR